MSNPILSDQALSDIRVIDLSNNVAGAYCTRLFADYGADVIKIEPPLHGDMSRRIGPFPNDVPHTETSGLFIHLNGNKRSVTLDVTSNAGAKLFKELITHTDLIVETFRPGHLESFGIGYDNLSEINPSLTHASITPFGQTGPYAHYKATDIGIFAASGRMYPHGDLDREPLPYAPDVVSYQIGSTAAVASMGSVLASKVQSVGDYLDISAMETLLGNVDNRLLFYAYTGDKTPRQRWPVGAAQGAYPCLDGYVVFGVGHNIYFERLCDAMNRKDIYQNPKWDTPQNRGENAEEFDGMLIEWLMNHDRREVFEMCQAHRVMCSPIFSIDELLEDPQLVSRGFFVKTVQPGMGSLIDTGAPFILSKTPWRNTRPAPLLGQHNREIFCETLGISFKELDLLKTNAVI
ncbi:CoA transferase [SAR202 cluster bacterium AD-804-J14_MRT_500m]|nr:CoA transferase [SAR202 cluster bacterium AD-804-J14_MRT_500m]